VTPPATQASAPAPDALTLDPVTVAVMIRTTMDTLPHHPDAGAEERNELRHAAYVMFSTLRPRDVMEAMLAARITAAQFHILDDLRCAAQDDLPASLKLRYRRSATALTRMQKADQCELTQRQAFPAMQSVALPASIPAARPQPVPAAAPSVPVRQAAPASRPEAAAAGQRPAAPRPVTGGFVPPTEAEKARLVDQLMALEDERMAARAA
jgi:hypothetical protein